MKTLKYLAAAALNACAPTQPQTVESPQTAMVSISDHQREAIVDNGVINRPSQKPPKSLREKILESSPKIDTWEKPIKTVSKLIGYKVATTSNGIPGRKIVKHCASTPEAIACEEVEKQERIDTCPHTGKHIYKKCREYWKDHQPLMKITHYCKQKVLSCTERIFK